MHGRRDSLGHGSDLAEPVSVCKESVESLIVEVCVVKSLANNVEHRVGAIVEPARNQTRFPEVGSHPL